MPLTYRSIGVVGLAVQLDDRARRAGRRSARKACARGRARPRRARGCRRATARAGERAGRGRPPEWTRRPDDSAPMSSSALDMRTTKAFGTSWTSRAGSPQIENAVRTACGVLRVGVGDRRRPRVNGPGLRRPDLDLGAEHRRTSRRRPRPSSGSWPPRRRTARARRARARRGPPAPPCPSSTAASSLRAVERDQEDVAAGDAVDVGDRHRHGGDRARRRTRPWSRRSVVTSPSDDLARRRTSRARRGRPRRSTGRAGSRASDALIGPAHVAGDLHGAAAAAAARAGRGGPGTLSA